MTKSSDRLALKTDRRLPLEQWCFLVWFEAHREILRREREVYPEWVDIGGEDP